MNTLAAHHVDDMTPYTQSLFHCSSRGSTDDHNLPITIELPQHMPPMISPKLGSHWTTPWIQWHMEFQRVDRGDSQGYWEQQ